MGDTEEPLGADLCFFWRFACSTALLLEFLRCGTKLLLLCACTYDSEDRLVRGGVLRVVASQSGSQLRFYSIRPQTRMEYMKYSPPLAASASRRPSCVRSSPFHSGLIIVFRSTMRFVISFVSRNCQLRSSSSSVRVDPSFNSCLCERDRC